MSELENKDNQSTTGGNIDAAQSNRGEDAAAGSVLRSPNTGDPSDARSGQQATVGGVNGLLSTQKESDLKSSQQMQENRKLGSFPSDLSSIKPIFSLKSKS